MRKLAVLIGFGLLSFAAEAQQQWQQVTPQLEAALENHWVKLEPPVSPYTIAAALGECDTPMTLTGVWDRDPSASKIELLRRTQAKGDLQFSTVDDALVLTTRTETRLQFNKVDLVAALANDSGVFVSASVTSRNYRQGVLDQTQFSWAGMSEAEKIGADLLMFVQSRNVPSAGAEILFLAYPLDTETAQQSYETNLYVRCGDVASDVAGAANE